LYLNFNPSLETFTNAEKHVLSCEGYEFSDSLNLYQYNNLNDSTKIHEDHSIHGDKYGGFTIINDAKPIFKLTNFEKPFYVKIGEKDSLVNRIGTSIQKQLSFSFTDSSSLVLDFNETAPFYTVTLIEGNKETKFDLDLISTQEKYEARKIQYGYPLKSFVIDFMSIKNLDANEASNYQNLKEKLNYINNLYLVRELWGDKTSNLVLTGKVETDFVQQVSVNGVELKDFVNSYQYTPENDTLVFSLSYNKLKPERYHLAWSNRNDKSQFRKLDILHLQWYPLFTDRTKNAVSIFFTSNSESVVKTVFNKGIHVRGNINKDNSCGFDASINYQQGSGNDTLNFQVLDHYFSKGNQTSIGTKSVNSGDLFYLNTRGNLNPENNQIYRIFKLRDIESQSSFKPILLYSVLIAFFLVLLFILVSFNHDVNKKITFRAVLAPAAVLIMAFTTFKFFLFWRTSVFLPVNDITPNLYKNYNNANNLWINTVGPFLLFAILALMGKYGWYEKLKNSVSERFKTINPTGIIYLMLIGLFIARLLGLHVKIEQLDRLTAIYIPLILYLFAYYLVINNILEDRLRRNMIWVNIIVFSLYFFIADAGFAIIFIIFILFKQILYNLNSANSKSKTLKYRLFNFNLLIHILLLSFVLLGSTILVFLMQTT
jgi:hypothetical protein